MQPKNLNYLKAGFIAVLAIYGILCAWDTSEQGMLDRVDLVIHEAGHLFFSWFGEFIQVSGGTIGQLFVPAAITAYFFFRRELYSSAVSLFWAGQNFVWISVYVKDAQAMALPLVSIGGGEDTIHDWNYILSHLGLIKWDHAIGNIFYATGVLIIAASIIWGFYHSIERDGEAE